MVSKKAFEAALKKHQLWNIQNPDASTLRKVKRSLQTSIEGHEVELGWHTLPSVLVPMPEESVLKLKPFIDKHKRK